MSAAQNGHTSTLQALIQAGATVDQARTNGSTALTSAGLRGHTSTLQTLIQAGAKVDQARTNGSTALTWPH